MLHQFRTDMIEDIERRSRPARGLVMVQHVDGFGTPAQKLDTFHTVDPAAAVLRSGFKLFYDEDTPARCSPASCARSGPGCGS